MLDKSGPCVHILLGSMLKRLTAFLFVLTLTGSVWAGICDCVDGSDHSASSCCKRERSDRPSIAKKPCCGSDCGQTAFVDTHRTQTESTVKIPMPASLGNDSIVALNDPLPLPWTLLGDRDVTFHTPYLARPPNLYIRHHSLLI